MLFRSGLAAQAHVEDGVRQFTACGARNLPSIDYSDGAWSLDRTYPGRRCPIAGGEKHQIKSHRCQGDHEADDGQRHEQRPAVGEPAARPQCNPGVDVSAQTSTRPTHVTVVPEAHQSQMMWKVYKVFPASARSLAFAQPRQHQLIPDGAPAVIPSIGRTVRPTIRAAGSMYRSKVARSLTERAS